MIKLEDLKVGDRIYGVIENGLGLYAETIVVREVLMLDLSPNPTEAVMCKGGIEVFTREREQYFFRTKQEAVEKLKSVRIKLAEELIKSGNLMDRLFECATSSKRLKKYSEQPIYEIAIGLYKELLKGGIHYEGNIKR